MNADHPLNFPLLITGLVGINTHQYFFPLPQLPLFVFPTLLSVSPFVSSSLNLSSSPRLLPRSRLYLRFRPSVFSALLVLFAIPFRSSLWRSKSRHGRSKIVFLFELKTLLKLNQCLANCFGTKLHKC